MIVDNINGDYSKCFLKQSIRWNDCRNDSN